MLEFKFQLEIKFARYEYNETTITTTSLKTAVTPSFTMHDHQTTTKSIFMFLIYS